MPAEIISTQTPELFDAAVKRATELLRTGEVVALPTETVYGLAANAFDAKAVSRIYQIKDRPQHNPLIVHVAGIDLAKRCVTNWPALADKLASAFWPGPLTLVLLKSKEIPDLVTASGPTIGVRWPSHPFVQAVIGECGFPLAAPSANLSERLSPTNAEHVRRQIGDRIRLIVDGGQSQVGIESTVLDLTAAPPRLLRPGMIYEEALLTVTGELALGFGDSEEVLKSPGLLRKHYSPKARLVVLSWCDDADLKSQIEDLKSPVAKVHVIAHTHIPSNQGLGRVRVIPHDAAAFARAIYAELHRCDESGAKLIVIEAVPATSEWRAIADRLNRAAAS